MPRKKRISGGCILRQWLLGNADASMEKLLTATGQASEKPGADRPGACALFQNSLEIIL
jgi:hypothetical protein